MRLFIRRPELADSFGKDTPESEYNPEVWFDERDGHWYMAKSLPQYGLLGWVERAWHAWLVFTDKACVISPTTPDNKSKA